MFPDSLSQELDQDPINMRSLSEQLEGVGAEAYNGAVQLLILDRTPRGGVYSSYMAWRHAWRSSSRLFTFCGTPIGCLRPAL